MPMGSARATWAGALRRWAHVRGVGSLAAVGLVALITAAIGLIPTALPLGHRAPIYLIAVLAAGAAFGRGPAIVAAVLSFLAYDWFFVAPAHTLHVANSDEWQALLLFLVAAVVTGHLTAALRERAEVARRREREAVALRQLGEALAGADSAELALAAATDRLQASLALARCDVLLADGDQLQPLRGTALERDDQAAALWVLGHGQAAVRGRARASRRPVRVRHPVDGLTVLDGGWGSHSGAIYLPLSVEDRTVGVLYAVPGSGGELAPEETRLLAAARDQLALAVERRRLQRETVQAEVLKRTDELRAALLSSVSHDLRTPLAAIKAAAGSLLQHDVARDDATRLACAAQIEREADRLNRLVDNLLDLSRIEAGALVLDRQWYPLGELIADTAARLGAVLADHRVEVAVPETLPPVYLDYVLIQQVLANLLENAAKYSPAGARIRVSVDDGGASVRVRVEDEGPGLPPAERDRVFERFYRVNGPAPEGTAAAPNGRSVATGARHRPRPGRVRRLRRGPRRPDLGGSARGGGRTGRLCHRERARRAALVGGRGVCLRAPAGRATSTGRPAGQSAARHRPRRSPTPRGRSRSSARSPSRKGHAVRGSPPPTAPPARRGPPVSALRTRRRPRRETPPPAPHGGAARPWPRAHRPSRRHGWSRRRGEMPSRGARILVVDDEPEIIEAVRRHLAAHGYDVSTTASGAAALAAVAQRPPDVILLDLGLPDMDGLEVVRRVRERGPTPIIVVSARYREADKVQALTLGADDYLAKPFGVSELVARVQVALRHGGAAGVRERGRVPRWGAGG